MKNHCTNTRLHLLFSHLKVPEHFSNLLQLSDVFHKPLHHLRHIQHIHGVSEPCSLQGVCVYLVCHSDSIGCVDGPLKSKNKTGQIVSIKFTNIEQAGH